MGKTNMGKTIMGKTIMGKTLESYGEDMRGTRPRRVSEALLALLSRCTYGIGLVASHML